MKNKFSTNRFSYDFTTRTHRNVLAWLKPASVSERSKRAIEGILRWEDDGGPVSDTWHPRRHPAGTSTAEQTDTTAEG